MCRYKKFDKSSVFLGHYALDVRSIVELETYISCYFIFISACASEFTHKASSKQPLNGALRREFNAGMNPFLPSVLL